MRFFNLRNLGKVIRFDNFACVVFLLACSISIIAYEALAQSEAQSELNSDQAPTPIEILSNSLEFLRSQNVATFTGDVVAQQGELMITAETLILHFSGSGEGQKLDEILGRGRVSISQSEGTATADNLQYPLDSGFATLSGDVEVREGPSTFTGDRATFNVETGNSVLEGSVRAFFIPDARSP